MKIKEIVQLLDAEIIIGENRLEEEIKFGFASDLMSDVLTLDEEEVILITGLCNIQTIRTVEMSNINVILFVRDKKPTDDMIELAKEENFVMIKSKFSMFKAAGVLYKTGLNPIY